MLTDAQKRALLDVARQAVLAEVMGAAVGGAPVHLPAAEAVGDALPDAHGAFVTLKRGGELRGCLGTLQLRHALAEEVARCAADAATRDPRFPPLGPDELADLSVEVSVLGPLGPIDPRDPRAIAIGRDGLVVEEGGRRGLLLPQVATEHAWTVDQFLGHTCIKAGLPPDAWRRGARVFRFEADVFGA